MKKSVSLICVVALLMACAVPAFAATPDYGIMPCYIYIDQVSATLHISNSGLATMSLYCSADNYNINCKFRIQKENDEGGWDNVTSQFSYSASGGILNHSRTYQLEEEGYYRIYAIFTVYGSSSTEQERVYYYYTY